jgi:hypothetical protein
MYNGNNLWRRKEEGEEETSKNNKGHFKGITSDLYNHVFLLIKRTL